MQDNGTSFSTHLIRALAQGEESAQLPSYSNPTVASMTMPQVGVVVITNREGSNDGLVIAGGIHGNERAGIVSNDQILRRICAGQVPVRRPLALVYGNLEAMRANARCIETHVGATSNLNRCFGGKPFASAQCYAERRANQIIAAMQSLPFCVTEAIDIHQSFQVPRVRDVRSGSVDRSNYNYAMLYPRTEAETLAWIFDSYSDIVAGVVLNQIGGSYTTFAGYMASRGAHAATFEQGEIGSVDALTFTPQLCASLCRRIAGEQKLLMPDGFDVWRIARPVIKASRRFTFVDAKGHPISGAPCDFTSIDYPLIAQDGDRMHTIDPRSERLLFGNSDVPDGDRAGVVIRREESSGIPLPEAQ